MFTTPDDEIVDRRSPVVTPAGGFSVPEDELMSDDYWGDVKRNAIEGVKEFPGMVRGLADTARKIDPLMAPIRAVQSGAQMIQGKPFMETPTAESAKATADLVKGIGKGLWQGVKDTGSLAKMPFEYLSDDEKPLAETEFGQKFRERPISAPLGVLGTVDLGNYGLSALKGLRGAGAVTEGAVGAAEDVAAAIPKEAPIPGRGPIPETPPGTGMPPPSAPMGMLDEFIQQFKNKAKPVADDTLAYINRSYKGATQQPGRVADVADYAQEASQMMSLRAMGGNPNLAIQARRVGKTPIQINNELRAIGQYGLDNKIVVPELGNKFMLDTQQALQDAAGGRVGGVRMMADEMALPAKTYTNEVIQNVNEQLGSQYAKGFSGAKQYQEALRIVGKHPPTYQGMADAATELNKLANKANKNFQPHTPFTDVANKISDFNNERIKAVVGPDMATIYESALREYGVNVKIQNMLARKVGQGLHRIGPGTLKRAAVQKFLDEIGYKGGARVLNRLSGKIKVNPGLAKNLPELFKSFINEVEDVFPDESRGMAFGGIVGEMDQYLTPKYGGKV